MTKQLFKDTSIRFLILAIPYFSWFAVVAKNNYQAQTYNLNTLIVYPFFWAGLILIEILYF